LCGVLGYPVVPGKYERQAKHMSVLPPVEVVERLRLTTRLARWFDGGYWRFRGGCR
jgi:hypothetical protein